MTDRILLITFIVLSFGDSSRAASEPFLPPRDVIRDAIASTLTVRAARADIERARAASDGLAAGPHEFQLEAGVWRRLTDNDGDFTEWTGGISRGVRWLGKAEADRDLGRMEVEIAAATLEVAWRQSALKWAKLWSSWLSAGSLCRLTREMAADATQRVTVERRRIEAKAGRTVNLDRLQADASLAELEAIQACRKVVEVQSEFEQMFPDFVVPPTPPGSAVSVDAMAPVSGDADAINPVLRLAKLQARKAELLTHRARLDLRPDPKVGVQTFSERDGEEIGVGLSLSFPITGGLRRSGAKEAAGYQAVSSINLQAARREAEQSFKRALNRVESAKAIVAHAEEAANAANEALKRIEEGRELRAVDISTLIQARQTWRVAERERIKALSDWLEASLEIRIRTGRLLAFDTEI